MPSEQPIDAWLRDNVNLDTTSPIQGPYDVANSPQMREPLLAFQDELVRMVTKNAQQFPSSTSQEGRDARNVSLRLCAISPRLLPLA
jgi:hypothetical protein